MPEQPRWYRESWVPILAGLIWLYAGGGFSWHGFLVSVVPGCLLLTSGVATLLYPGDLRIPQFAALGGVVGVLLGIPGLFLVGPGTALGLMVVSAAAFVAAGALSVRQEPHFEDVPVPRLSLWLAAQVAADDALLGTLALQLPMPGFDAHKRIRGEVHEARERFRDRGFLEKPVDYHRAPPPLPDAEVTATRRSLRGFDFEQLSFESGYEPEAEEPGRERWLSYGPNRRAHAWVMRHLNPERPWLLCIHGYQMGNPAIDLRAFRAARLHHKLGLNLVLPVLPLHGPRKIGRISGDGFLAADFLDSIHAEAQAMWDMRRLLDWMRQQGAPRIGVMGLSLGGYNTALLTGLDDALACSIPGIPATDFARLTWRHASSLRIRYAEAHGVVHDEAAEVLRVISPLAVEPLVPKEHRFIFGGIADRLVPPDQVRDLWRHWDEPEIVGYDGAHLTVGAHPAVMAGVDKTLREAKLIL